MRLSRLRGARLVGAAVVVATLTAAGIVTSVALGSHSPNPDPALDPIPEFDFDDPSKSFFIQLDFNGPVSVSLVSAEVVFGRAQSNLGKPPMLLVQLFDHSSSLFDEFNEWSPLRIEFLDPEPSGGELAQAVGVFSFPFVPHLSTMKVTDIDLNQELIEVDLVPAILDFCEKHPAEPECGVDLGIVSFEAIEPPSEILVGDEAEITLRKVITNDGPLGIMDTRLTTDATASPGATVSPAQVMLDENELVLDEERVVEETFTVSCQEASSHTFTFVNQIEAVSPFIDPDPANNEATVELEIECVVPVVINIKPGSSPNSVNPRSRVPVAVLSTSAGEYGTPLDFDATTIDPNSVLFGPADAVFPESAGATEVHERGHLEDSREMDEKTRDGDLDMVLHFKVSESGLGPGDQEACVKGQWVDDQGGIHKFFGCDSVSFVPK